MIQEQLVLAAILIDNRHMKKSMTIIEPSDFIDLKNRHIYEAMLKLDYANMEIDYGTLMSQLDSYETAVDISYLILITNLLPTAANIDTYLKQLKEVSNKRKIIKAVDDIKKENGITSEEASSYLINVIDSLEHIDNTVTNMIYDGLDQHVNDILDGKELAIAHKTLYPELDDKLAITDGGYYVIGARPGVGKSAHALNLTRGFLQQKKKVYLVSLEMTKSEVLNRLLSMISGVDSHKITRRKGLTPQDRLALENAKKVLAQYDLEVYDRGGLKIEDLLVQCNIRKQKGNIDILILDYIGLVSTNEFKGQRANQIGYISRKLKQIAMDLRLPVIALSQLNRNVSDSSSGKQREPNLTDIRDSGSVEQDANAVMFLYSKVDNEEHKDRYLILKIAKNRNGKMGKIRMVFHTDTLTFNEVAYNESEGKYYDVPTNLGGVFD